MDTQPVQTLSSRPKTCPEHIRKVAQEFESLFSSIMLRAMRNTVGDNPLVPTSLGEDIYTGMLDTEYAKVLADNANLGLSDLIVRELERHENRGAGMNQLQELHNLRNNPWSADPRFIVSPAGAAGAGGTARIEPAARISKWESLAAQASRRHGVDKNLISAVIAQESGGNPRAVSPKGAKGLMQLMDSTAAEMGVAAPFSPWANVNGGTRYLRFLLDKFSGDERLALASYNAGPAAVQKYGTVPPYRETQEYVASVLEIRRRLAIGQTREEQ